MSNQTGVNVELPKYKCYKEVHAIKISALEIHQDGSATIAPADYGYGVFKTRAGWASRFVNDNDDPGYYVVYKDGFTSWSPTKAFEEGYERL